MIIEQVAFAALAGVAVATAALALLVRELVHTILWIAVFFVALSGIYFLLSAPFLGVLQLGVYAGAVTKDDPNAALLDQQACRHAGQILGDECAKGEPGESQHQAASTERCEAASSDS